MMDPVNVAARANRYVHFLANAGLFQSKFTNWFFSTFFCFPVQRKKDDGKRRFNNKDSFAKSYQFLADGGCLYIAAEGVSTPEHDLKPLKTGTARIALAAEEKFNWEMNLQIVPVGIYYDDAQKFRSRTLLNTGTPISVKTWKENFIGEEQLAVRAFTQYIQEQLESLMVITESEEQNQAIRFIDKFWSVDRPVAINDQFNRIQSVSQSFINKEFPLEEEWLLNLKNSVISFPSSINGVAGHFKFVWYHALFPVAIFGALVNSIPTAIILLIEKMAKLYEGYTSSLRVLAGVVIYPIAYRTYNSFVNDYIDTTFVWPFLWFGYLVAGIYAFHFFQDFSRGVEVWQWRKWGSSEQGKKLKYNIDRLKSQLNEE